MTAIDRAAEVLFAYNTTQGLHFVVHGGDGYEGIAQALADAGLLVTDETRNVVAFAVSAYQTGGIDGRSKLGRAIVAYLASREVTA